MGQKRLNLEGVKFGNLTVVKYDRIDAKGNTNWFCRCDCGETYITRGSRLKAGVVISCRLCSYRRMRNPDGVGDMSIHYWTQVMNGARRRSVDVEITKEYAYQIFLDQGSKCALSGDSIWFPPMTNRPDLGNASLDRIDSSKGYVVGNVQWVHKLVNRMKMNLTETDFIDWCEKVVKNRRK